MNIPGFLMGLRGVFRGVDAHELAPAPVDQFRRWFESAKRARMYQPNAFQLATCSTEGRPAVRTLLLKGYDARGFLYYTNYESRKGRELAGNPQAMMLFFWNEMHRQVRIEGRVDKLTAEESARYFHSRPRGSQVGAWASHQSSVIKDRAELEQRVAEYEKKFAGSEVPLPPYWGGFRLVPDQFEFWQGRAFRLHDRFIYRRTENDWRIVRLAP